MTARFCAVAVVVFLGVVLVPQALAGTFIVSNNLDSGDGSLRQAIIDSNGAPSTPSLIRFAIGTGTVTITAASPLPAITKPVVINGLTQPGINPPNIVLDGSQCTPSPCDGLVVEGGGSTIEGLAVVGFAGRGIVFDGSVTGLGGNSLISSWVGWSPTTASFSGSHDSGVAILSSPNNTIGDGSAAGRVIVAGNGSLAGTHTEILISGSQASGNVVSGNWIGLAPDGTTAADTPNGVVITAGATGNTIGGAQTEGNRFYGFWQDSVDVSSAGSGNIVAGNSIGLDNNNELHVTDGDTGIGVENSPSTVIGDSVLPPDSANPNRGNVVVGATGDVGVLVTGATSTGTTIAGNFIGTDRQFATGLGNGQGVRVYQTSGVNVGPGNTIAENSCDGVEVASGTSDRVVANSIYDNGLNAGSCSVAPMGIRLDPGANNGIPAPVITDASTLAGTTSGDGTFHGAPHQLVYIELFANPACDSAGSGQTYLGSVSAAADGNGNAQFSFSAPTAPGSGFITATATDQMTADTSEFSNCFAALASGDLSVALSQPVNDSIDLTAAGTQDWAVWGYGSSTSLAANVQKAGGSGISDLSPTNQNNGPARNFGQFACSLVPFCFNWSDGVSPASATSASAGITAPQVGQGFSFTVPADTTSRTLTVWTSSHYANGTLTATLSDGSAAPITYTVDAEAGQFTGSGENVPEVFALTYNAASGGQHLTVTWTQDTNNGCPGCDDVVLYAAALAGPSSGATGATAQLSTAAPTVGMAGSNDSIAALPLSAFQTTASGVTPAPINGLPINGLPINGLPINGLPINGLPINGLPINGLPINGLPINGLPINGLPINGLPINGLPINGLPINGLELPGVDWPSLLGPSLSGKPLQTITLQQVLAQPNPPEAVQHLTLGQLEIADSDLGKVTIGALALGSTPINGLGLDTNSLNALQAWCSSVAGSSNCDTGDLGRQSLFALALAGAPINGLPINGLPINGLPINGLPINGLPINGLNLSASPINGLPINGLPINGLPLGTLRINGLDPSLVDCSKLTIVCSAATLEVAVAAGAISPSATLGDLRNYGNLTIGDLLQSLDSSTSTVTLGDVIGLLIKRNDVPWETLPPSVLAAVDLNRPTLHLTAGFTVQGSGTVPAQVAIALPSGFDFDPGSATMTANAVTSPLADPAVTGARGTGFTLTWSLPAVATGVASTIDFKVRSGTDVGPVQATETVTSGGVSSTPSIVPFSVTDGFTSTEASPESVTPDTSVQMSALSTTGAVDYYTVPMPSAGTRLRVHLTNLPADYDLALYSPRTTSVRTGTAAVPGPPLQDGTVADQSIDLTKSGNAQLGPTALQDVPDPGIPVVQVSANRGTDDEDVGLVSPGGGGVVTIAVFGYNGASSAQPYTLRVTTQAPPTLSCTAHTFSPPGGVGGTLGPAPNVSGMPANLNTLFLVNEKRIGDTYGAPAEGNVVSALNGLAARNDLGVSGAVLAVDGIAGAQTQYGAWDANPCDVDAANAIANTIANEVAAVKAARPSLKYVVFAGGDDQIPFFRVPDLSLIANENGFASQFAHNEYYGALASSDLLSDNPYLDTRPVPASGRQLFVPNLVGGRLVETDADIVNAATNYENAHGTLNASTGFVSGYDFVTDGSKTVAGNLRSNLSGSVGSLLSDTWSKSDLLSAAFPAGGPANINDWNGHYDNTRALMANGDLLSTADLTGQNTLPGGIFFTMGCHAGFQTTDAVVGSSVLDWAQYFAGTGTAFVGNTGFGLGNTDSVAFSEELMGDFAGQLTGRQSIGEALTQAKAQYFLSRVAFSSYDEKTLSEAELYGLPMYGVGSPPAAVNAAVSTPATPDPVTGSTASTSPSQGTLSTFPGTGVQAAGFDVLPDFSAGKISGPHGDHYENGGQVQAPNYRPLQPYVTLPAGRSGTTAHGVVIDALTSQDHTGFNPDNVRPTVDLSANELEPQFDDEAWPTKIPTLVSLFGTGGLDQSVNLATGQFFTETTGGTTGTERLWTHIGGRVTYSSSTDFTPPTIDSIDAFLTGANTVSFTGHFSDLTGTGAAGSVAFAQVVYDLEDSTGHWNAVQLQYDPASDTWSGGAPFAGAHIQFFVEACDTAGNCGFSSNKGRYFDAAPLPSPSGSVTITPAGAQGAGPWFKGAVHVTAASTTGADVTVSVDGGPYITPPAGGVVVSGDGAHTIDARSADGSTATTVVLIDSTPPLIDLTGLPAAVLKGAVVPANFSCTDRGSGVSTCVATSGVTGGNIDTSSAGNVQVTVTATDAAGNIAPPVSTPIRVVTGPSAPGQPTASKNPNQGTFTLGWTASAETPAATITYSIERSTASNGPWTPITAAVTGTTAALNGEPQGSWYYHVVARDPDGFTATSPPSAAVVVDTTPPTVTFDTACPALVDQGTTVTVAYSAADTGGSGLATPAHGSVTLDTSSAGSHSASATATDNAGNMTVVSCSYVVNGPPTAPGKPTVSVSPNLGQFTVSWTAATDPNGNNLTYKLLHQNAHGGGYTQVAAGLALTYSFTAGSPEAEGTWTYEVIANDGRLDGSASAASAAVIVDRSAPNAPTLQPSRAPDATPWYKDSVVITTVPNGDPVLADGSAGSGIDATKTTPPQTITANGSDTVTGSVTDKAGNAKTATATFKVDAKAPTLTVTCPAASVPAGLPASATWTASDGESGLQGAASGSVALNTAHIGSFSSPNVTATDKVGHATVKACTYTVAKGTPIVTWATPASIIYGTKLGPTQLNATAAVNGVALPGTFVYLPAAGVVLQPGTQTLSVTFTPTNTTDYNPVSKSVTISVTFTQACITTTKSGPFTVASGQSVCVSAGGKLVGAVTVQAGGALWISGGSITGPLNVTKAAALSLCGATVTGPVNVATSAGYVLFGGAAGTNCAGNSITGPVTITGGTGGLSFVGNKVVGPLTITNNKGGFTYSGNTVTGPVNVTGNS